MSISYRDGISIFQLIVFFPCLFTSLFLWRRDGFSAGSAAWRFAFTLSVLRIVGGISTLALISHPNSTSLATVITIAQVIGTPPLSLSCITLGDRLNSHVKLFPHFIFIIIVALSAAGLGLGIYGADTAIDASSGDDFVINRYIKAAMAIFLVIYASLVALVIGFGSKWSSFADPSDRRVYLAMLLATPFIGVKHIYSSISDYGHVPAFNLFGGNTTVYLIMSVLVEMVSLIVILGFGLTLSSIRPRSR